jgi:hypothetical protein
LEYLRRCVNNSLSDNNHIKTFGISPHLSPLPNGERDGVRGLYCILFRNWNLVIRN